MENKIKLFIKDIEKELEKIDIIVSNILELKNILKGKEPDKFYIITFAGFLHTEIKVGFSINLWYNIL